MDLEKLISIFTSLIPEHLLKLTNGTEIHSFNMSEQIDVSLLSIVIEANEQDQNAQEEADEDSFSYSSISLTPNNSTLSTSVNGSFSSLFYSLTSPSVFYRCLNDSSWTFTHISEGCFRLTGYPREHLLQNWKISHLELIVPEDRERVRKLTQDAIESSKSYNFEYSIKTATGEIKKIWEKGIPVLSDGGIILEGIITEIQYQKAITEEIKEKNKQLEEKSFYNLQYLQSLYLSLQDILIRYQSFIYDIKIIGNKGKNLTFF